MKKTNHKTKQFLFFCLFFLFNSAFSQDENSENSFENPSNPTTINGHVYFDQNGNGTQDSVEPNSINIDIIIFQSNGGLQSITTDVNGNWIATVPAGITNIYLDTNDLLAGYTITEGTDPTTLNVIANQPNYAGIDGIYYSGTLSGHLYFDTNGNGIQNTDEPNMPNVSVSITDGYGTNQIVSTNALGNWQKQVALSTATVLIDISDPDFPSGATQTEGVNPISFVVVNNTNTFTGNNGFYRQGTLTGHLYHDVDGNGIQTPGEPNMANVMVTITNTAGFSITVTTNSNGNWTIQGPSGLVTITIDTGSSGFPLGATQTEGTNPSTATIATNNTTFAGNNGFFSTGTLTGHLYYDLDQNGTQSANEPNMPNVTVFITDVLGNMHSVVTNSNGNWSIVVIAGTTISNINFTDPDFPAGATQTQGTNPTTTLVLTQQTIATENCGFYSTIDSDGDGIFDAVEISLGSDKNNACDPQQNSTYTGFNAANTIWANSDCDGDGITNGVEFTNDSNPYNPCDPIQNSSYTGYTTSNPIWAAQDCDGDGLSNGNEIELGTNPLNSDTDGDGISDFLEVQNNTEPRNPCDPSHPENYTDFVPTNSIWANADCDGDGVANGVEFANNSNPYNPCDPKQPKGYVGYDASNAIWAASDCDEDGVPNGEEEENGSDPYDPNDNGMIIYDGISPNGDGVNDFFVIKTIENYPVNSLQIFNRWGVEVFSKNGYKNEFDGTSKGRMTLSQNEKLPFGNYFYVFIYKQPNGETKERKGILFIN